MATLESSGRPLSSLGPGTKESQTRAEDDSHQEGSVETLAGATALPQPTTKPDPPSGLWKESVQG